MTTLTRYAPKTDPHGLSLEDLKQFPALFAKQPSPKMSERYTFLSTFDIIEPLLEEGYAVTHVSQRATRLGHRDPRYTRHLVRMRRLADKPCVGDVYPEVHFSNSHDGQSRYLMHGGLLRLACLNGMAVSTLEFQGVALFHRGELEPMLAQIRAGVTQAAGAIQVVEKMAKKKLGPNAQKKFAHDAVFLPSAFDYKGNTPDFDTSVFLAPRRDEDKGNDLWSVYNRVQENIIRGGVQVQHEMGERKIGTTRGITHIRRETEFNLQLWQLAAKLVA